MKDLIEDNQLDILVIIPSQRMWEEFVRSCNKKSGQKSHNTYYRVETLSGITFFKHVVGLEGSLDNVRGRVFDDVYDPYGCHLSDEGYYVIYSPHRLRSLQKVEDLV